MTDQFCGRDNITVSSHPFPGGAPELMNVGATQAILSRYRSGVTIDSMLGANTRLNATHVDGHVAQWRVKEGAAFTHVGLSRTVLPPER